jgi:galactokinase
MELCELKIQFEKIYGPGEVRFFIGPARVNLIGEHTDYNGGYVLPCALDMRSACAVRRRKDGVINLASTSYPKRVSVRMDKLDKYRDLEWGSYQLGVAYMLKHQGYRITGCDMLFDETVPHGSGLSSSAAIEIASALAFTALSKGIKRRFYMGSKKNHKIFRGDDMADLALIAQKAENEYVGMNCGIMDQFASAMGKRGHAVLLRCSDLDYSYVPFEPEKAGLVLVIANTGKPRALIKSKYNERRAQCESALADLKKVLPDVAYLADLTPEMFEEHKKAIKGKVKRKRAQHVICENARVKDAAKALAAGDYIGFGKLMCESHESLRDLYEVTGKELDTLYDISLEREGAVGSRMTGAGFGGCTVSLVESDKAVSFIAYTSEKYASETGFQPEFYISGAADGAREEKV